MSEKKLVYQNKKSVKKPVNLIVEIPKNYVFLKKEYLENICDMIIPNLFLGDIIAANSLEIMKDFDVIINVSTHNTKKYDKKLHIQIPIKDDFDVNIIPVLNWILEKINFYLEDNKKVFIHCRAGISRSVSVVLGYLIKYKKFDYESALEYLKSMRKQITSPNIGFSCQLRQF